MTADEHRARLFAGCAEAFSSGEPPVPRASTRLRVLEAFARSRSRSPASILSAWSTAFAAAVLVAGVGVAAWLIWPTQTSFKVAGRDGDVGAWLAPSPGNALALDFSEGTRIALSAGSRGRVSQVNRHGARIEFERGTVNARVTPRAGAHWSFGAGPFDVSVLGTNLDVSWSPEAGQFSLSVSKGSVLVRGPFIKSPQLVQAGQVCRVDLSKQRMQIGPASVPPQLPVPAENSSPAPAASPDTKGEPVARDAPERGSEAAESWRTLGQTGRHRDAVLAAEKAGLSTIYRTASAEALLELAGTARLSGRPEIEKSALLACRDRHAAQPASARAAYLLGRASSGAEAARWFELYLREQPRGLLAREASGRLIESYQRAGNPGAARQSASGYLAAHPDGPHATLARQVLAKSAN